MKLLKKSIVKSYSAMLTLILSVMGLLSSCEKDTDPNGLIMPMYGAIQIVKFEAKGKIKSSDKNKAIEGIRVVMQNDTAYTNMFGNYSISFDSYPKSSYDMEIADVDGKNNGSYYDKTIPVTFESDSIYGSDMTAKLDIDLDPK
ncbi:MAG: hypothetical protein HOD63_00215 [Bacteroidetes bacterium]|jgi:putative lipoprotein (rSAM/lipoprotein system)|nr:hypothetical protein [Bacteroidota bacterium]MBT5528538.1 hypothetical protein [Cytophagia bacterium]MBT3423188.1 hypothetical protein [Bacteroidota bacterium]MBT3802188.1 hypothetical protein [Bacteroidota bacterium]MBT3935785.1 hypothetical protein [Bacteroidota bacterium]